MKNSKYTSKIDHISTQGAGSKRPFGFYIFFGCCLLFISVFTILTTKSVDTPKSVAVQRELEREVTESAQEVTNQQVESGIARRQKSFEGLNPLYPSSTVRYSVANTHLQDGAPTEDRLLWDTIKELAITNRGLNRISDFEVYFDESDLTLAAIQAGSIRVKDFSFIINYISVTDFEELSRTIVHEHAHIYSLNDERIRSFAEDPFIDATCATYRIEEGCTTVDNPLTDFYTRFWGEELAGQIESLSPQEVEAYYSQNTESFVNDYAATNPVEDFAESFMIYVFSDLEGLANSEKDQKILFFDQVDELREYRLRARDTMASW